MSPVRLKDLRSIPDLDHAKAVLRDMTGLFIHVEARKAAAEKRIQTIKEKVEADNSADVQELRRLEETLTGFIAAHQDQFVKPRAIKTDFGQFGLRQVTELQVQDESVAIQHALDDGHDDCLEVVRKLIKKVVRARIEAGEKWPGCRVNSGDVAFWKPNKALVEEEVEGRE